MMDDEGNYPDELQYYEEPTPKSEREGWTWVNNSPRWHYFRGGISLCGAWQMGGSVSTGTPANLTPVVEQSDSNCARCRKRRRAERVAEGYGSPLGGQSHDQ